MPNNQRTRKLTLVEVAAYCEARSGSSRTTPFGPEPVVYKVAGRMFALLGRLAGREIVSLKCDPERSVVLRTSYGSIVPGYHLNKEHWNTLVLDGSLPPALVTDLIDHSHALVERGGTAASRSSPSRLSRSRPRPARARRGAR